MATEISAGGVIVKKIQHIWYVLLIQDKNDQWTFPKGKVEEGESFEETAVREIAEEVGVTKIRLKEKIPSIHYMYTRNGPIRKTVHYFVYEISEDEPLVNQKAEGIHNATWVPISDAVAMIGYPKTNKEVLIWTSKRLQT